jgi:hypothetical protein
MYNHLSTTPKSKSIPIYEAGHRIGSVRGDTFHKTIHGSRHIWKKIPSIGLSIASMESAKEAGALRVCIKDAEDGREYFASLYMIASKGIHYTFPGYEPQIFLRLEHWSDRPVEVNPLVFQEALPLEV